MVRKIVRHIRLSKLINEPLSGDAKRIDDFCVNLFNGLIEHKNNQYEHSIYYVKYINEKREVYIELDSEHNTTWLSEKNIWSFFAKEFNYTTLELKELIQSVLEIYMGRKIYPIFSSRDIPFEIWEHI